MVTIYVAGLAVGLDTESRFIRRQCEPFLTAQPPELTVRATEAEICAEQTLAACTRDQAEFVCLHRALAYRLLTRDRFVLHGAAIQIDGRACLFTAKSGVGKSTHIRLWREVFGARVRIVNGDKPILWKRDGRWLVCGTPWCGKEGWTSTDCVPAAGLCLLERAPENEIHPASEEELADHIFHQIPHPAQPALFVRELELLGDFLAATPCWQLRCTPTPEAARLAAKTMLAESMELEPEAFETASTQQ